MADVIGTIGNEIVELNNAATEATLKQLLSAIQNMGGTTTPGSPSAAAINTTNTSFRNLTNTTESLNKTTTDLIAKWSDFTKQIYDGTTTTSGLFSQAAKLSGSFGFLFTILGYVAKAQEDNLKAYQDITKFGSNFGGNLTQLREAATRSYVSFEEFTGLIKNNSETFVKMGGTVNQGAIAFTKLSNQLLQSSIGDDLRALGYTTSEVNQGMLTYINLTGGRSREELKNTKGIVDGTKNYLEQLDRLSSITGESREQLEKKLKEEAANAAWEAYLLTLDEEGRKKANAALFESMTKGGKGAADALKANLMGIPVQTEVGQKFVGTMQNANQAVNDLANNVRDSSKSLNDIKTSSAGLSVAMAKDGQNLRSIAMAQISAGKDVEMWSKILQASTNAQRNNINTVEDQIAFEEKQKKEQEDRKKSEAAQAVEAQKALKEMEQGIMAALLPALQALTPIVNSLVIGFSKVITTLLEYKEAVIAVIAAYSVFKVGKGIGGLLGGGGGGPGGGGPGGGGPGGVGPGGLGGIGGALIGMSKGLASFANPTVLAGSVGFGIAIAAIGAGLAGATWIMSKALPTLAEGLQPFEDLNGDKLAASGKGILILGTGLAVFGTGGIAAGIGTIINGLANNLMEFFGKKTLFKQIEEFSDLNFDSEKIKLNSEAMIDFGKAMSASGIGNMLAGLGNITSLLVDGISSFFNKNPPYDKLIEFERITVDADKIKYNANAFVEFSNALAAYKGTSFSGSIINMVDGIGSFFANDTDITFKKFTDFGNITINADKIKYNANAFVEFSNALAAYKGTSFSGSVINMVDGVGSFFANDTDITFKKFTDFGNITINADKIKYNANAFVEFSNAMSKFKGGGGFSNAISSMFDGLTKFFGGSTVIDKFVEFSKLNIDPEKTGKLAKAFSQYASGLNLASGNSNNSSIPIPEQPYVEKLNETDLNNLKQELETLNKQTAEVIRYLRETADYTKQNVDATKSLNGDLFRF